MKSKRLLYFAVTMFIVLGGFLFAIYTLSLLFNESLECSKYSYAYFLTVHSDLIKNFPKPDLVRQEAYGSSCGDGSKPPSTSVYFTTKLSREKILPIIEEYLLRHGLMPEEKYVDKDRDMRMEYNRGECGHISFSLFLSSCKEGLQVVATEYE